MARGFGKRPNGTAAQKGTGRRNAWCSNSTRMNCVKNKRNTYVPSSARISSARNSDGAVQAGLVGSSAVRLAGFRSQRFRRAFGHGAIG